MEIYSMQPDQQPAQQPAQTPPTPTPVTNEPATATPTPQPPLKPGKKKLPLWAKILLIAFGSVVTLIGVIILGFFIYANSLIAAPMKVSDQFINAVQSNDASSAYNLTTPAFKAVTKEDRLKSIFDKISPELQGKEKVSDKHYRIYNGVSSATIIYKIPADGDGNYVRISLRKDSNDKWAVQEMYLSKTELKAKTN